MKGKDTKNKVKIKYDDKGRKVYDFSDFNFEKDDNLILNNKPKEIHEYLDYKMINNKELVNDSKKQGTFLCSICNIEEWNNKPLSMQLDHIDGDPHNHKLENLRLICPNCHSQTETYCGRNKR